jgi:hypothetical protein
MSERIKSLLRRVGAAQKAANELEAADLELRERMPVASVGALERAIASEIAHSLGRAAHRLETALAEAMSTLGELGTVELAEERSALIARFNEQRAVAERRLRDLIIQREALGFRRHAELHHRYPIPPRWHEG